jgi:hypothetical protein
MLKAWWQSSLGEIAGGATGRTPDFVDEFSFLNIGVCGEKAFVRIREKL